MPFTGATSRRDRAVDWLIAHIPAPLLVNPERVAVAGAIALIGATTLVFVRPASLSALLPHWVIYLWGVTWLLGGLFALVGNWRCWRAVEMAGHRLIILGAVVYGLAVAVAAGLTGFVSILLIAIVVGLPSAIRLLVAAGSRRTRSKVQ